MYILFEGVDGVGKSTQISLLVQKFPKAIVTKEPGGSEFGKFARQILLENEIKLSSKAELLLFLADRAEHAQKIIKPNINGLILSDRGFVSGIAYALANDENLNSSELLSMNKFALNNTMPDKIIFFYGNEDLIQQRIKNRGTSDKIEARGLGYLLKVQNIMDKFLCTCELDTLKVDASQNINTIHKQILNFLGF